MARSPNLRIVDEYDDLIGDDTAADTPLDGEIVDSEDDVGIDLETAVSELHDMVSDAVDFISSELIPVWEHADEVYNGATAIKKEKGRSQVTATVVRDTVRSLKPNMMRTFVQYDEICEYEAANALDFQTSVIAQAQSKFNNQLFWRCGGYRTLLDSTHNALLKRAGIMKSHYSLDYKDDYVVITDVPEEGLEALSQMQDVTVVSVEEDEVTGLLRVEVARRRPAGSLALDGVNLDEFFVDDEATCPDDARVIGERKSTTVGDARRMGLEYDGDWKDLDDFDIEENEGAGSAEARKGYTRVIEERDSVDDSLHEFLLTEVYVKFDLDGTGIPQLYRFWLGGTNYEYIDHDRVEDNPYSVAQADPIPGAFFGKSVVDTLYEDQNTQTSLLRATCDNAHAANNKRLAVHDTLVNMQDVMNKALGAPIRFRQPGMIQEIGVESSLGTMLPLLEYLKNMSNDKMGVTNASMGLDPDALQSTDKDAVRNTIQLAQGQVELMCRNMGETGLTSAFKKLLKLSMRHNPPEQAVFLEGQQIPINQRLFDPEAFIKVKIGLGTGNVDSRLAALQQVANHQKEIMTQFGLNNPICTINQHLNVIVDMGTLMGLPNMGRYYNQVTPELAQQLDQMLQEKAEAAQQEPPSKAVEVAETIRAQAKIEDRQMQNEWNQQKLSSDTITKITELLMNDDRQRDEMAQDLEVEKAKFGGKVMGDAINSMEVAAQQDKQRSYDLQKQVMQLAAKRGQDAKNPPVPQQQPQQPQQAMNPNPMPMGPGQQGMPPGM